jgi:hypothetical protein
MGHPSSPQFQTFHALRIKGFADVDTIAAITALDAADVELHLSHLEENGYVMFREQRSLWQLTPDGRTAHVQHLHADLDGLHPARLLHEPYEVFLAHNTEFKALCGDWQLRDGEPNDHSDPAYDQEVVDRLVDLHGRAHPVVGEIADLLERFEPYPTRLEQVLERVLAGESNMFTGVMCGSYHDVWMELHEDLILTQGIDRAAEGSF